MRRIATVFVLILVAASLFATAGSEETAVPMGEVTEPVTIQIWYSLGAAYSAPLEEIIADFNAENDLITVEGAYQGAYAATQEKLLAAYIANDPPVLSQLEQSLVGSFVANDALVPLEDFIAADPDFDRDDFFPELLAGASYGGKLYGFPINVSTPVLYINRDLFRQAGLDPDDIPTNWNEVYEVSKALANPDGPVYGVRVYNSGWIMDSFFQQFGGKIFSADDTRSTINSPEIKEAMGFWQQMVADGSAVYQGGGDGSNMDAAGQIGMVMRSTGSIQWFKDNVTFDWGVAPYALGPNRAVSLGGGNVYMIKRTTEQEQLAAWEFLNYLTSTENQVRWSLATGYMVSRRSAFNSPEIQQIFRDDPRYQVTYDQIPFSFPRPKVEAWPEIEDIIQEAMTRIVQQGESVDILDQAARDIDELL
jgi:sn-glycerol 3-phosphate transport system substrate-binding protein